MVGLAGGHRGLSGSGAATATTTCLCAQAATGLKKSSIWPTCSYAQNAQNGEPRGGRGVAWRRQKREARSAEQPSTQAGQSLGWERH